ncbi:nucleoside phosphorylase domain-containing protein [Dactylonectria estremocensis]|uniref:Nucleoside phosphorylase domain-containing protein n=1 Tax=Dactylonectria estremocensis TaxID=1079267 RepID=A0A9P9J1Y6_9HYPO|nr:nucleoside phosphorylase domain-containing protein [Dactylonectria estremocensis]
MVSQSQPTHRTDFHVAIICALSKEADAVTLLFDQFWDNDLDPYGRALGDTNTYVTGRIGAHDVVLVVLPNMGTTGAAAAAASFRSSYNNLRLALLVGICGGVPRIAGYDAFLGDVVVSKTILQYDYGRQYPGSFALKSTVDDSLGRANKDIRGLLASFETELGRERLQGKAAAHLRLLQTTAIRKRRRANYQYPGAIEDKLFSPGYTHKHRMSCSTCANSSVDFCESASKASCAEIGCDEVNLVLREPPVADGGYTPEIFIGCVGSGNTVMKSGQDRDRIARTHDIIAFEMEGAGIWDEIPCIVVKGICDYADSHKNKKWQDFAAASAASVARAMLERYAVSDNSRARDQESSSVQGLGNNGRSISQNTFGNNAYINQGDVKGNVTFR